MDRETLLRYLSGLRRARVGGVRAPHKPLLLLWLFSRFAETGSSRVTYAEADEPVSLLIADFGPPAAARHRAAMPFVHLERELWDPRDGTGAPLAATVPERHALLVERGVRGGLTPPVEALLATPEIFAEACRLLLDQHFTAALATLISERLGLDVTVSPAAPGTGRVRRSGFAEEVLRAYAYSCAMCGFDGGLGRHPVALQAAHVRWHSQGGPDVVPNGLALCVLHHTLFDLGVLGVTAGLAIQVSDGYVPRGPASRAVADLHGIALRVPYRQGEALDPRFVAWHSREVFRHPAARV